MLKMSGRRSALGDLPDRVLSRLALKRSEISKSPEKRHGNTQGEYLQWLRHLYRRTDRIRMLWRGLMSYVFAHAVNYSLFSNTDVEGHRHLEVPVAFEQIRKRQTIRYEVMTNERKNRSKYEEQQNYEEK